MELLKNCNDFMTINDLYAVLPLGKNQIYKLIKSGEIKSKFIGNKYIVPKTALIDYFNNL